MRCKQIRWDNSDYHQWYWSLFRPGKTDHSAVIIFFNIPFSHAILDQSFIKHYTCGISHNSNNNEEAVSGTLMHSKDLTKLVENFLVGKVFRAVKSVFDVVLTHNMISHQPPQEHSYCVQVLVSHHKCQQCKIKQYLWRLRLINMFACHCT